MDAIEALKTRKSVRQYETAPIPKEILEDIIDCGRLAATGRNVQPWEFVCVTDAGTRKKIAELAEFGKFIVDAPACIIVLCADTKYYIEDGSAATQNILVAAKAHGLGTCWVAGDKKPYCPGIAKVVGAPGNMKVVSIIAIGVEKGDSQRSKKRPLKDVLHWEKY